MAGRKIVLVCLAVLILSSGAAVFAGMMAGSAGESGAHLLSKNGGYPSHDPIYINGNDDFIIGQNGVVSGSGTEDDPYIIENWDIDASQSMDAGIYIENTDVYFVIRNCVVHNGESNENHGIYFYNVTHGKMDSVTSYNNSVGILLFVCSNNNNITNCVVYNNSDGIALAFYSTNNTIANCTTYNNFNGVVLNYASNNEIHYNNIYNNTNYGIYNDVYQANATYNWWGSADGPSGDGPGTGDNITDNVLYEPWLTEPWKEESELTPHDPIYINGNSDFTSENGVSSGNGTVGNPYVIENWDINASSADGIWINNTDVYFVIRNCVIRNCVIHDGKSFNKNGIYHKNGIYLYNVTNSKMENVSSYNNWIGILLYSSSNNTITNCNVYNNNYFGICLESSSNNNIINCAVYNNYDYGILISSSSDNNTISNCDVYNNEGGIGLGSFSNTVANCSVYNNYYGIWLGESLNNILRDNVLENNNFNFGVGGGYQDIDTSNTINGKPIYYIIEQSGLVFNDTMSIGYLGLISCTDIIIENLTFTNNIQGILLANTSYSKITNCTAYNNSHHGISLRSSSHNTISNCDVYNNNWGIELYVSSNNTITDCTAYNNNDGILLSYSSNNNTMSNFNVYNNSFGIWLYESSNNHITNCDVYNNSYGIYLTYSSNNNITNCDVYNNSYRGIRLEYSSNNEIHYNNISNNTDYGIWLYSSSNNEIHYNNIYNNTNYGVHNGNTESQYQVNATYNWWGSVNGPGQDGANPVSSNVLYDPWLTEPIGLISHAPISINSNSEFTEANGVTSGSGTQGDPYIIENWDINASSANGIVITNTNVYFIIRNCVIHDGWNTNYSDSYDGVYFYLVQNGKIENCEIYNNSRGIKLEESSNNQITNCYIYNNPYYGIWLDSSSNNIITNCPVYNNSLGICLESSSNNNQITDCTVYNSNSHSGIFLASSSNNSIINCAAYSNSLSGIHLFSSSNNIITNCNVYNNSDDGIRLESSSNNNITNCEAYNNDDGIALYPSSNNNQISNCTVYNNHAGIYLHYYSSNNNITNCTISNSASYDIFLTELSSATALNTTFNKASVYFADVNSTLNVSWYLDVGVLWNNSIPAEYVDVRIFDNLMNEVFNGSTDKNGWIKDIVIQEYTQNQINTIFFTPHNVTANKTGYVTNYSEVNMNSSKEITITLSLSGGLTPHLPIYINGNSDFASQAESEGWAGDGTEYNPYIIENYDIEPGSDPPVSVYIMNTDVYFIIRNCLVQGGHASICFSNVTNGKIESCDIHDNFYGILLDSSSNNNTISDCTIYNNSNYGIRLSYSSNNQISNCTVYNNNYGIYLYSSSNNEIHYCNIYDNTEYGVFSEEDAVNAAYNWWGSADGPSGEGPGSGDAVSDNVIYDPWLTGGVLSLIVTVSANPTTVNSGETSTITITVTDGTNPVSGATINLQSDNSGSFSTVTDNGDGTYTATFTTPTVTVQTVCRVTAQATKTGYTSGSNYVDITVNPAAVGNHAPIVNSVTANPTTVSTGGTVTITVVATDEDVDDTLTYYYDCNAGTISGTGSTVTWTAPDTTGNYTITIYVNDGEVDSNTKSVVVMVTAVVTETFEDPTTGVAVTAQYTGTGNITIASALSPGSAPSGVHGINIFVEVTVPETMTVEWLYIEVPYNESDLPAGVDESKLRLFYWTDTGWEKCEDTGVDTVNNIVWANVTHLTIFAPMAEKAAAGEEGEEGGAGIGGYWWVAALVAVIIVVVMGVGYSRRKKIGMGRVVSARPPPLPPIPPSIKKTIKPETAGVLLLVVGILGILQAIIFGWAAIYDPPLDISTQIVVAALCSITPIIFSVFAILGGICALRRRRYDIAGLGSVLGIFTIGFFLGSILSIIALILIVYSKNEFGAHIPPPPAAVPKPEKPSEAEITASRQAAELESRLNVLKGEIRRMIGYHTEDLKEEAGKIPEMIKSGYWVQAQNALATLEGKVMSRKVEKDRYDQFMVRVNELTKERSDFFVDDIKAQLSKGDFDKAEQLLGERKQDYERYLELQQNLKNIEEQSRMLSKRLAKGELTSDAYERAKDDLDKDKYDIDEKLWKIQRKIFREKYEKPF